MDLLKLKAQSKRIPANIETLTPGESDRVKAWLVFEEIDSQRVTEGILSGQSYTDTDVQHFKAAYVKRLLFTLTLSDYHIYNGGVILQSVARKAIERDILTNPVLSLLQSMGYEIAEGNPDNKTYCINGSGYNITFN